jgi:hypothetical protein
LHTSYALRVLWQRREESSCQRSANPLSWYQGTAACRTGFLVATDLLRRTSSAERKPFGRKGGAKAAASSRAESVRSSPKSHRSRRWVDTAKRLLDDGDVPLAQKAPPADRRTGVISPCVQAWLDAGDLAVAIIKNAPVIRARCAQVAEIVQCGLIVLNSCNHES